MLYNAVSGAEGKPAITKPLRGGYKATFYSDRTYEERLLGIPYHMGSYISFLDHGGQDSTYCRIND